MEYKNCITEIAQTHGRDYITPEDVTAALEKFNPDGVRRDLLMIIGKLTGFGAEDVGLCAFVAWKGKEI